MSDTEVAILKSLFPPDGAIPTSLIGSVPQIHSRKGTIIRLLEGGA